MFSRSSSILSNKEGSTAQSSSSSSSSSSSLQNPHHLAQHLQHDEEQMLSHADDLSGALEDGDQDGYDSCSLASDVPSLDRSSSDSSDNSSHEDIVSPLGMQPSSRLKPRLLRQRNSGNDSALQLQYADSADMTAPPPVLKPGESISNSNVPAVAVDFIPQFLLPQNMTAPIPKGPVRKHSDFEQVAYKGLDVAEPYYEEAEPSDLGVGRFRRRDEIVLHFMVELNMLRRDLLVMFLGFLFQWFHSIFTNIAYYYHTHLSAAQRVPLKDIAYDMLPVLSGSWWMVSEYLVFAMIAVITLSIASILIIRWNAPHGRPLYCVPILRRMLITLTVCQVLRCVSFLITTLPGASRQCLYEVPHDMTREEMISQPAHDRGNPMGWAPPITMNDILFRVDATNGCGDLMFSSHTIFTMLFVCVVWRYFNWGFLKWAMLSLQLIIVPFILAAHKHYSVDVFTALYVTPLVFEVLRMKLRDLDVHSADMAAHYGIRFRKSYDVDDKSGQARYIMSMRGGEFYVELADIPLDLQRAYEASEQEEKYPSCGKGNNNDLDYYYDEDGGDLSDFEPAIV